MTIILQTDGTCSPDGVTSVLVGFCTTPNDCDRCAELRALHLKPAFLAVPTTRRGW